MADLKLKLIPSQKTFIEHRDDLEYAYLAGIGTGKSFVAALWTFIRTYKLGEKLFVGSQTWSTTEGVQFKAITDLMDEMGLKEDRDYSYKRDILEIKFKKSKGVIKGCCSAAKKSIEGYTKFSGAWFDEASNWDEEVKNYVMGRCRNAKDKDGNLTDARYRYTGTPPLVPSGWYYRWLKKNPDKYVQASTLEGVGKYLTQTYYDQQVEAWGGKDSPLTRIMVYGELPSEESSNSIFRREHRPQQIEVSMGIDCSGGNNGDETYFIITNGLEILHEETMKEFTFKERNAKALELITRFDVKNTQIDQAYGAELGEWLEDNTKNVSISVIPFGGKPKSDRYLNNRAEMYYNLADRWSFGDKFFSERMATVPIISSSGRLQLIAKEQIKKVIGHSPDGLDALALAMYVPILEPIASMTDDSVDSLLESIIAG